MGVKRLKDIPGFNIDRVAAAAGNDRDVLRLENLDTNIPPPAEAVDATRAAVGDDDANSWLPFTGRDDLKEAVAAYIERRGGPRYDGRREIVITSGEGDAMLDALFCLTDPGDEVVLTDPTYAGMLNRVRLVGAVSRLAPLHVADGEWQLDLDALRAAVTERTRVIFVNNASFPSGWAASDEEWEAKPSPRSAGSRTSGFSTGADSKASSSTVARSGIRRRFPACATGRSPSAPPPSSSA
jgi:aspartate/methionine/tyrosine aminotransferase